MNINDWHSITISLMRTGASYQVQGLQGDWVEHVVNDHS